MSTDNHQKIVTFLTAQFSRKDGRQAVKLELLHAELGFRGNVLRSWIREDEPETFEDLGKLEGLASAIIEICEQEADSHVSVKGKRYRFALVCHQFLGGRERTTILVEASYSASSQSEDDAAGDGAMTIATGGTPGEHALVVPNNAMAALLSMVGQQMRHNERHMATHNQIFAGSLQVLSRVNEDQAEEIRALRAENSELLKKMRDALDTQDERDLRALKQVAADERKKAMLDKMLPLVSVAASRYLGAGPDGAPKGLAILVSELASSLQPEQIKKIAGALQPTQQILLMEAMKMAKENAPKPAEEKKPDAAEEKKAG